MTIIDATQLPLRLLHTKPQLKLCYHAPVEDAVLVQELEGERHLSRVEPGAYFSEFARLLYLEHEVSSGHVLHDEEQAVLWGGGCC